MFPKRVARKTIYESDWINLHVDKVKMPSGKIIEKYHQLDYPYESVGVLLFNTKNEICLIESLRYSTNKIEWEVPAGGISENESLVDAAKREVVEETGFVADTMKTVYSYNPSNGLSNELVHILFGRVNSEDQAKFDTDEVKSVNWVKQEEVKRLLSASEIKDGISVLSLLLYFSNLFEL